MILPVITRGLPLRVAYALALCVVYTVCLRTFWFERMWLIVDGGALGGFLSHSVPMLLGSLLHDWCLWVQGETQRLDAAAADAVSAAQGGEDLKAVRRTHYLRRLRALALRFGALLAYAGGLMAAGYLLTLPPQSSSPVCFATSSRLPVPCVDASVPSVPFVQPSPDVISMWTMSHRSASISIQLFASGYAVAIFSASWLASDVAGLQSQFLTILSTHSLLVYILRDYAFKFVIKISELRSEVSLLRGSVSRVALIHAVPIDSPLFMAVPALVISLLINVNMVYYLHRNRINLRL